MTDAISISCVALISNIIRTTQQGEARDIVRLAGGEHLVADGLVEGLAIAEITPARVRAPSSSSPTEAPVIRVMPMRSPRSARSASARGTSLG